MTSFRRLSALLGLRRAGVAGSLVACCLLGAQPARAAQGGSPAAGPVYNLTCGSADDPKLSLLQVNFPVPAGWRAARGTNGGITETPTGVALYLPQEQAASPRHWQPSVLINVWATARLGDEDRDLLASAGSARDDSLVTGVKQDGTYSTQVRDATGASPSVPVRAAWAMVTRRTPMRTRPAPDASSIHAVAQVAIGSLGPGANKYRSGVGGAAVQVVANRTRPLTRAEGQRAAQAVEFVARHISVRALTGTQDLGGQIARCQAPPAPGSPATP